ncbi:MAG: hypothetical protein QY303_00485 [Vicingaceae bacterium]|nr:MAG: hypothetical protein QY303_00485 [Vicingaceae bacterium]
MFYTRKTTLLTAAALVLLLFTTCKKKKEPCSIEQVPFHPFTATNNNDDCINYIYVGGAATMQNHYHPISYHMPCFNPNNPNEFCYLFKKQGVGGQLRKHNLQTGEDKLIYPISFSAPPKWGKNGKITFASGYQVCTIDEDGKNIKKLTTVPYNMYPAWLNDTTIICYYSKYFPNSTQSLRININSNTIDTLEVGGWVFDVAKDGKICIPGSTILYSSATAFQQHQWEYSIKLTDGYIDSRCAVWHPNCEDIFYTAEGDLGIGGLFKVNIYSKQSVRILPECHTRTYKNISISPDGKNIIAEKQIIVNKQISDCNYNIVYGYVLEIMDINGNNRMELKLPE